MAHLNIENICELSPLSVLARERALYMCFIRSALEFWLGVNSISNTSKKLKTAWPLFSMLSPAELNASSEEPGQRPLE
jgi:hypothetical protein